MALGTRRLHVPPLPPAELAIRLNEPVIPPAAIQERGIETLAGMNVVLAGGALVASFCTLVFLAITRAARRRTELLIHRAVGASRKRLLMAGAREGIVMVFAALLAGAALGVAILRYGRTTWPGAVDSVGLLLPVAMAAAMGATIFLGVVIPIKGLGPMRPGVPPLAPLLAPAVCAAQLAVCFAVLVESRQVRHEGLSLVADRPQNVAQDTVLQLTIPADPVERARQLEELIKRSGLSGLFDVASLSSPGALDGLGTVSLAIAECGNCYQGGIATPLRPVQVSVSTVSADTFRALNTHLVSGRLITNDDDWRATRVAVINQTLARAHFQDGNPVGRHIQLGLGPNTRFTVVGVVEDQRAQGLGGALQPRYFVYTSVLQLAPSVVDLLVRPRRIIDRARILSWIPGANLSETLSATERRQIRAAPVRWFGTALSLEAISVALIAFLGIGLSMAIWVISMVPDIAVHRAVGARRRDVLAYVGARAGGVTVAGLALGLLLAYLSAGPLSSIVPGVATLDSRGVMEVSLLVIFVTALAISLPALRATRLQPTALLASYSE